MRVLHLWCLAGVWLQMNFCSHDNYDLFFTRASGAFYFVNTVLEVFQLETFFTFNIPTNLSIMNLSWQFKQVLGCPLNLTQTVSSTTTQRRSDTIQPPDCLKYLIQQWICFYKTHTISGPFIFWIMFAWVNFWIIDLYIWLQKNRRKMSSLHTMSGNTFLCLSLVVYFFIKSSQLL